jgi:hypothetical protein
MGSTLYAGPRCRQKGDCMQDGRWWGQGLRCILQSGPYAFRAFRAFRA